MLPIVYDTRLQCYTFKFLINQANWRRRHNGYFLEENVRLHHVLQKELLLLIIALYGLGFLGETVCISLNAKEFWIIDVIPYRPISCELTLSWR